MCNREEIKNPTTPTDIPPVFSSQRAFYAFACSGFIWAPCTDFTDELSRCFCVCCKADSDVTEGNHVVRTPFHVRLAIFWGGCLQSSQLVSSTTVDSWQFGANARTKHTSLFRHLESEVPTNRFGFFSGFKKKHRGKEAKLPWPLNPWLLWLPKPFVWGSFRWCSYFFATIQVAACNAGAGPGI